MPIESASVISKSGIGKLLLKFLVYSEKDRENLSDLIIYFK